MKEKCTPIDSEAAEGSPLFHALRDSFAKIPDPRVNRRKLHLLSDILLLSLAAVLCGAVGAEDITFWAKAQGIDLLRKSLGASLVNGIPHHDTFGRMLCRLNPLVIEESLHIVRKHVSNGPPTHIAIDGKEVRGSHNAAKQSPAIMLLSAFATDSGLVIGQQKVDSKSNEIPAAVDVLNQIDIAGATVTADALHAQRNTAAAIRDRGGNYLLAVKDNQPSLFAAVEHLFQTNREEHRLPMQSRQIVNKDHHPRAAWVPA